MKEYIAANQLPMDLQRRVVQWFDFAWRYKKDMSEEQLFQQLSDNFRAEIAIHVNLDTLKKVLTFLKDVWEMWPRIPTRAFVEAETNPLFP